MITSASTRKDLRIPPRNPRFRVAAVVATALVVIASTSCSSPYRRPPENGFSGIADAFKAVDGKPVPEVDVLLVHGMSYHDKDWIIPMIQPLAVALGVDSNIALPLIGTTAQRRTTLSSDPARLQSNAANRRSPLESHHGKREEDSLL
jgi:hypothetical protein